MLDIGGPGCIREPIRGPRPRDSTVLSAHDLRFGSSTAPCHPFLIRRKCSPRDSSLTALAALLGMLLHIDDVASSARAAVPWSPRRRGRHRRGRLRLTLERSFRRGLIEIAGISRSVSRSSGSWNCRAHFIDGPWSRHGSPRSPRSRSLPRLRSGERSVRAWMAFASAERPAVSSWFTSIPRASSLARPVNLPWDHARGASSRTAKVAAAYSPGVRSRHLYDASCAG